MAATWLGLCGRGARTNMAMVHRLARKARVMADDNLEQNRKGRARPDVFNRPLLTGNDAPQWLPAKPQRIPIDPAAMSALTSALDAASAVGHIGAQVSVPASDVAGAVRLVAELRFVETSSAEPYRHQSNDLAWHIFVEVQP